VFKFYGGVVKRITAAKGANKVLPEEYEGIKIVERPISDFGKAGKGGGRGMHRLDDEHEIKPDSREFHLLVDDALRDNFTTIYVYNQGSEKKKPHLYLIKGAFISKVLKKRSA
jgi:hypothetical protein